MNEIKMFVLYKPNGVPVRVNEHSFEHGLNLGWTKENPEDTPKKKGKDKS